MYLLLACLKIIFWLYHTWLENTDIGRHYRFCYFFSRAAINIVIDKSIVTIGNVMSFVLYTVMSMSKAFLRLNCNLYFHPHSPVENLFNYIFDIVINYRILERIDENWEAAIEHRDI